MKQLKIKFLPQDENDTIQILPQHTLEYVFEQLNSQKKYSRTTQDWSCIIEKRPNNINISREGKVLNQIPMDTLIVWTTPAKQNSESELNQFEKYILEQRKKDFQCAEKIYSLCQQTKQMYDQLENLKQFYQDVQQTPILEPKSDQSSICSQEMNQISLEPSQQQIQSNDKDINLYLDMTYKQQTINKEYSIPSYASVQYLVDLAFKEFNLQDTQVKANIQLFGQPYNEKVERQIKVEQLIGRKEDMTFNISIT